MRTAKRKVTAKRQVKAAKRQVRKAGAKAIRKGRPSQATAPVKVGKKTAAVIIASRSRRGGPATPLPAILSAIPPAGRPKRTKAPAINRQRRLLEEPPPPGAPSTLTVDSTSSAARSGRAELIERLNRHTETGPELTSGDIDANWEAAYSSGDEAPGGDNPTPDQDVVEEIGRALGVEYDDHEELKSADKIASRDRHRWEFDPASAEDYHDRSKD